MRKWGLLSAALGVALVGCGGGGGSTSDSGGNNGGGGTGTTRQAAVVNLPSGNNNALLYVSFLTGAERSVGDKYLTFKGIPFTDTYGTVDRDSPDSPLTINLTQYGIQYARVLVPSLTTSPNSRLFETFGLSPFSFTLEKSGVTFSYTPGDAGVFSDSTLTNLPYTMSSYVRVFPGRQTILPVYVDNTMFTDVAASGSTAEHIEFDTSTFVAKNTIPLNGESNSATDGKITSLISDFVRIPLTSMATTDRPLLSDSTPASYLYVSGDNYAISDATSGGIFEELTPDTNTPIAGKWVQYAKSSVYDPSIPNQYTLTQSVATDVVPDAVKVSAYGVWRDYTSVLTSISTFEMIVFPNTVEQYTGARPGDMLAIARNSSGQVTNVYFGNADLTNKTFELFPIKYLVTGEAPDSEKLSGTFSNYTDSTGTTTTFEPAIRYGTYTFTGGTRPSQFTKATGDFLVFRK